MVRKLIKPGDEIVNSLNPAKAHIMHMAFGFIGEWHELATSDSDENHLEELGDMWFFLKGAALGLDVDYDEAVQIILHDEKSFTDELFKLHDYIKKYVIYDDESYYSQIQKKTYLCISLFREKVVDEGYTIEEVEEANKRKLIGPGGRYESGEYSDQQAKQRADKVGSSKGDSSQGDSSQGCCSQ